MKIKDSINKFKNKNSIYRWARNKYIQLELFFERMENPLQRLQIIKKSGKKYDATTMRLGVAYNLFDGEELIEYSIKSIRKNVDFVCVVWQKISNHGEPCSEGMEEFLNNLVSKGLIDKLYLYEPDITNTSGDNAPRLNEVKKRNIGLELCRQNGCNYHMTIDTDEFYTDEQFRFMKEKMVLGNYGTGYCHHIPYYKDSIYQLKYPERNYVSTFEKIIPNTKFVYGTPCVVDIDPTRKTNNVNENGLSYYIFKRNECEMHHMSFVRKDIKKKLWNHSCKSSFTEEDVDRVVEYYKNWKYPQKCMWVGGYLLDIVEVPRQFEIYDVD